MELFYAHYPDLEKSFLRFIRHNRRPLEPWLVVCASSFLARQLRQALAREQGAVAHVHFTTLSPLIYQLDASAGVAEPVFPQDHLRDFLLKEILTEPGLDSYPVSRGFVRALKEALRDLADSLADPEILEEQLRSSPDDGEFAQDKARFAWLVRVYRAYTRREAQLPGYRSYRALFERALHQVESSDYFKPFSKIIFYGFYDMPGRQLELVNRIRAHYPVTVFAPYAPLPAYQFARKFFETNWLGASGGGTNENHGDFGVLSPCAPYLFAPQGQAGVEGVRLVSAADTAGEVFFAAKEILRLVEQEHYAFSDIGLIARAQAPYQQEVRRVFAQNKIPLNASFSYPLSKFPLGVFCLTLFALEQNGFDRDSVLSLLASPYFKAPQKRAWRGLAEKSLVSLQLNQWRDLLPLTDGFDPDFLAWLENVHRRLRALTEPGPWAEKCVQARQFLEENLNPDALLGKEQEIYQSICACVDSLAQYSAVRPRCRAGEFVHELEDALNGLVFHEVQAAPRGVVFTDALRARGLSFKAVFVLGVNEKVFPQIVPDDPIFRDRYRYILRDVLGYWVSQKSERTQEERLLFFSSVTAARERLYVSYACMSGEGKTQVPSVYAAELARVAQLNWNAEELPQISGAFSARISSVSPLLLTSKEMSCRLMLSASTPAEHFRAAGLADDDTPRRLAAAQHLAHTGAAGAFDGFIQSGPAVLAAARRGGFSPSALQDLAACPMKYFFRKALHLADKEDVCVRYELAPDKRGRAYHKVLEDFYRELDRLHLTHNLFDSGIAQYLDRTLAKHYTAQSYRVFGIYPVVWELILAQMRERLLAFVTQDMRGLGKFSPKFFEKAFEGVFVEGLPGPLRGIIDRVDVNEEEKTFRIMDYKSSRSGTKDLAKSFFTHLIFQPFLYPLAAQQLPELAGFTPTEACLLGINKGYDPSSLSAQDLAAMRPQAQRFLARLAQAVEEGTFLLNPSDLCAYCPYSAICRKDSYACLMRARRSAVGKQLQEVRYGPVS